MVKKNSFILKFEQISIKDIPLVGGKNAALGEMYQALLPLGINVPDGFALTAFAYNYFLEKTQLKETIKKILSDFDPRNLRELQTKGRIIRQTILKTELPKILQTEIIKAYRDLGEGKNISVAVRSSATAEDLPTASFAGQQETYLNVSGIKDLLLAVKKCIASLFTDRAIAYRTEKGFSHFDVALSVGVQKMVRSDLASSGVAFTLDTETGFEDVVVINGSYGLGEAIVQGKVTPDEFVVWKSGLKKGFKAIVGKNLGDKNIKLVYARKGTRWVSVDEKEKAEFCLSQDEILQLARWCIEIENYFSKKRGHYQPMDIEWAKDGKEKKLYIVQARPETVHSTQDKNIYREYALRGRGELIVSGTAVGTKIAVGRAKVIKNPKNINQFQSGEILVTEMTDPDWVPIMKMASAIITDKGGRTSHAAIVSRELGIPAIVGTEEATKKIKTGDEITVDCSSGEVGKVYKGKLPFQILEHHLSKIPQPKTKIMINIGSPQEAFKNHFLPVKGVGLGRVEFIIASEIKIHPNALIDYQKLKLKAKKVKEENGLNLEKLIKEIDKLTSGYKDKKQFYVDKLAQGISKIGVAFWPNEVIIRFSDFKTNEYRKLLGGELYEPIEENPMIGWRGASRYYDPKFKEAFGLECLALKKVREEIGLSNIVPMIPFCRTPEEGKKVLKIMAEYGLKRNNSSNSNLKTKKKKNQNKNKKEALKVYVMCEIPSNILQAEEFLKIFDGMSIGSNDLTQLTVGLDRDSDIVNHIANENNPSVKKLIADIVKKCRAEKKYIGICGQAPSDYPNFAQFLVKNKIESISLNPDAVIKTILAIKKIEK